jgi:hypothetical protein
MGCLNCYFTQQISESELSYLAYLKVPGILIYPLIRWTIIGKIIHYAVYFSAFIIAWFSS